MRNSCAAIIGLGYVGLPLAVAFGKRRPTVGFDMLGARIAELANGHDRTQRPRPKNWPKLLLG